MTRILMVLDTETHATYIIDDPRTRRELVIAINTGEYKVASDELFMEGVRQWAMAQPPLNVITVIPEAPPYRLTRRHYQVLFELAEGKTAKQIGAKLGITPRTVYEYMRELKQRFNARNLVQLLGLAYLANMLND